MCSLPENLSVNWAHECVYKYCITKHTLNVITQLHSYSGPFLYLTVRKILCWTQASGSYIGGCCVLLVPCFFALLWWGRCLASLTSRAGSNGKMLASARQCTKVHLRLKMLISSSGQQMRPCSSAPQRLPDAIPACFSVMLMELSIRSHQEGKRD